MFFEGSEKKFELMVDDRGPSLRARDPLWRQVVSRAGASVLTTISNGYCDAYLLSESSLFVYDHKVIMITCGTTSLIDAVTLVLDHVSSDDVKLLVFERKHEHFPHNQPSQFEDDVAHLSKRVPGHIHMFGCGPQRYVKMFHMNVDVPLTRADQTWEVLMHDIARDRLDWFALDPQDVERSLLDNPGMAALLEGFEIDQFFFEPCGYSINAICDWQYFTMHVTPQDGCSYASIESNMNRSDVATALFKAGIDLFQPRECLLLCFDDGPEPQGWDSRYRLIHQQDCGFSGGLRTRYYEFERKQGVFAS